MRVDEEGGPRCDDTERAGKVVDEDVSGPAPGQVENKPCLGPGPGCGRNTVELGPRVHINLKCMLYSNHHLLCYTYSNVNFPAVFWQRQNIDMVVHQGVLEMHDSVVLGIELIF